MFSSRSRHLIHSSSPPGIHLTTGPYPQRVLRVCESPKLRLYPKHKHCQCPAETGSHLPQGPTPVTSTFRVSHPTDLQRQRCDCSTRGQVVHFFTGHQGFVTYRGLWNPKIIGQRDPGLWCCKALSSSALCCFATQRQHFMSRAQSRPPRRMGGVTVPLTPHRCSVH